MMVSRWRKQEAAKGGCRTWNVIHAGFTELNNSPFGKILG
jgi:hypothetical protein